MNFPTEVWFNIFSYLYPKDICSLAISSSKHIDNCISFLNEESYWKSIAKQIIEVRALDQNQNFKIQFKACILKIKDSFCEKEKKLFSIEYLKLVISDVSKHLPVKAIDDALETGHCEYAACILSKNKHLVSFQKHLIKAIELDCPILVRFLLYTGEREKLIDTHTLDGCTIQSDEILSLLVPFIDTKRITNLLINAVEEGMISYVKVLIDSGATFNNSNDSILIRALKNQPENEELISLLLSYGMDPTVLCQGYPAFIWAIIGPVKDRGTLTEERQIKRISVLQALINAAIAMGKPIIDQKDLYECTALMIAIESNNFLIAKFLVEQGANTNAQNKFGKTVLDYARTRDTHSSNFQICKWENMVLKKESKCVIS